MRPFFFFISNGPKETSIVTETLRERNRVYLHMKLRLISDILTDIICQHDEVSVFLAGRSRKSAASLIRCYLHVENARSCLTLTGSNDSAMFHSCGLKTAKVTSQTHTESRAKTLTYSVRASLRVCPVPCFGTLASCYMVATP